MDDDIAHLGIVDRALRRAPPGILGALVVVVEAHDVERLQVDEIEGAGVLDPAAEDEMEFAQTPGPLLGAGRLSRAPSSW